MTSKKIIECVPNFSEGKNQKIIDAIADAIRKVPGVRILDIDPGQSTNRTVYTFVGDPESVVNGALAGAKIAYDLIDMSKHHGEHKRIGAMDVCPFIPVSGTTMDDCVDCANRCAKQLAEMLNVPVYLYGYAALDDYRREVPQIRSGEYEGLPEKLKDSEWQPNYGPSKFVPSWGASIVGARKFLLAYNVNLISTKEQAHRIALIIRSNRSDGKKGRLDGVQAMGWYLKEQNIAQVTVNILDYEITSLHQVYEEVVKESLKLKIPVTGSEIVGMLPLNAILDVAEYYIEKENLFVLDEDQKVHLAIQRLGLNSLNFFDPKKRIIEYMIKEVDETKLVNQTVTEFLRMVADRTSAPGGGSVGATIGALGVGLNAMVAKLSYGKKIFDKTDTKMRLLIPKLHHSVDEFIRLIDADTESFNLYFEARLLPQNTLDEIEKRHNAMEYGLRCAIEIPLKMARLVTDIWPTIVELIEIFHLPTSSDLQVGIQCLRTAVYAAAYNIFINLKMDEAKNLRKEISAEIHQHINVAEEMATKLLKRIEERNPTE
ncbi:transcription factor MafG [Sarcoptes scabiei]|nr:transcription factor MafG [Sarcoptes scabiei]